MHYLKPNNFISNFNKNINKKNIDNTLQILNKLIFNLKLKSINKEFFIILTSNTNVIELKKFLKEQKNINIHVSKISQINLLADKITNINLGIFSFGYLIEMDANNLSLEELHVILNVYNVNLLAFFNNSIFYWSSDHKVNYMLQLHNKQNFISYISNYFYNKLNQSSSFDFLLK